MSKKHHILKRTIILAGFIAFVSLPSTYAAAMGLKENSSLTKDTIVLGDVFYGLTRDKGRVLGNAPRPGEDMTLNAQTLMRIAIALDLPWRPSSNAEYIVLHRAATIIESDEIRRSIIEALNEKGVMGSFELKISNDNYRIVLPEDQPGTFEISKISYNAKKEWFEASIVAPSKENPISRINVSGKVQSMTEIPVLRSTLRKGSVIHKNDITYMSVPSRELNHDTIINADELIGMTPSRVALANRPIKEGDIAAPRLIKRGETITMIFADGPLTLTATGKALENGAKGDFIRVANSSSSRTVQAIVTGTKEVTIKSY